MRDGEISRAMRLLHSFGIAGITEDILRQMARKHPPRQHSVPQQLPGPAAPAVAPMELTETFRGLRRRAGTGVSGRGVTSTSARSLATSTMRALMRSWGATPRLPPRR